MSILSRQTDVTAAVLAADLGVDESQIQITSQDGTNVFYKIREYETTCSIELCDVESTEKCTMRAGNPTCICKDGFGGDKCEERLCAYSCAHGGRCIAPETCTECGEGWKGTYCGTVISSPSKTVAVVLAVIVDLSLGISIIIVLIRRRWIPVTSQAGEIACE